MNEKELKHLRLWSMAQLGDIIRRVDEEINIYKDNPQVLDVLNCLKRELGHISTNVSERKMKRALDYMCNAIILLYDNNFHRDQLIDYYTLEVSKKIREYIKIESQS